MVDLNQATTEEIHDELARRDKLAFHRQSETAAALVRLDQMRSEERIDYAKSITMRTVDIPQTLGLFDTAGRFKFRSAIFVVLKE
jgi:hypothetical protein